MVSDAELRPLVAQVCEHLYDLVYLRTHPLRQALVGDASLNAHDAAWKLHHQLLDAIEELDPGPQAPLNGREWRRHRLLVLRYVEGLAPDVVAQRLSISERSYYREQRAALAALASVLSRHGPSRQQPVPTTPTFSSLDRLELLRLEAARAGQAQRQAAPAPLVEGVLATLQERLAQQQLCTQVSLPADLPDLGLDGSILRQLLLGMLSYLIERSQSAAVTVHASAGRESVELALSVRPAEKVRHPESAEAEERLAALEELAALGQIRFKALTTGQTITGFALHLPREPERTVLVVDDNDEVVELYRRYLAGHGYHTVAAHSGHEALAAVADTRACAILLDVMMPGHDGWDVLQALLNRPDSRHIPVIVCSVLRQKELALSLGATAFLEKPVTEQALLAVLQALT